MRGKMRSVLAATIASFLFVGLAVILGSCSFQVIQAKAPMNLLSIAPTPSPSATSTGVPSHQSGILDLNDPNTKAAIIGGVFALVAAIISTIITVIFSIRQNKRNHKLNKELERIKRENNEYLLNLRKEHEEVLQRARWQIRTKDKEERQMAQQAEAARIEMEQAKSIEELARAYRTALLADLRISSLQILGMSQPLKVEHVYVRVRVHQGEMFNADLDPQLRITEVQRNPDVLLRLEKEALNNLANSVLAVEPEEAIRNNSRCVIVGDPGVGKTTLLKYLALKSAQDQLNGLPDLPIFIELNKFVNFISGDLLDFAATQWYEDYGFPKDAARIYIEDNLKAGKALLLLDALDETMVGDTQEEAEATYQRMIIAIMKLSTRYHQSPIVVTARKAGYRQRKSLAGFTELEVADFRPEDITMFVSNWFAASPNRQEHSQALKLTQKIEGNPRIQGLAANPLLLSLIVIFYKTFHELPERRAALYKRCVDILLVEWDTKREIHRRHEFSPEHTHQLLAKIAWEFHNKGRHYFPESDLLDVISEFLQAIGKPIEEKNHVLLEMEDMHGLLKPQAWRWHGFLHLTLQEYFVAQYIITHNKLDTLLTHIGDPWWEEIILLYAAQVSDASPLLCQLLNIQTAEQLNEDIFYTNLILAGRCLVDQPTVQQVFLRQEIMSLLSKTLMSTPYSLTKEQIITVLSSIDDPKISDFLLGSLTNEALDQTMRWRIAEALAKEGERSIVSKLLIILSDTKADQVLRQIIAETLGMRGDRSVAHDLLRILNTPHLESDVQKSIVKALGLLGERSVAHELLHWLSNQRIEVHVRCSIAEVLGSLGEPSLVANLLDLLLKEQTNSLVRSSIAKALGVLGDQSIASQLLALIPNERVNRNIRYNITETLGRLRGKKIIPAMRELASNQHIDLSVRNYIIVVLGRLGEESVITNLVDMLSDAHIDAYVRRNAADALSSIGSRSVVFDLLSLLANSRLDINVRMSIAHTIGKSSDISVVPYLLNMLKDSQIDPYVRRSITEALGALGEPSVAPTLLGLLSNIQIDLRTRQIIAIALGNLASDRTTVESLAALLNTSDIADQIHQALWTISRRARVRVFMASESDSKLYVEGP